MRKFGLGIAVVAVVALFFLLRFLLGTLAFLLKVGVVIGVGAAIVYVAYQLWSGWERAGDPE